MDVNPVTFDVAELVKGAASTVSPLVTDGVKLTVEVEEGIGEANTDEARVRQMVINLLSNAIKFTERGEIKLKAKMQNGKGEAGSSVDRPPSFDSSQDDRQVSTHLVIAVSDTGKGIPPEELLTIFDEYRQVKGQLESGSLGGGLVQKGTGLGLSITKKFAELLGGAIKAESEIGKGSTFTITIPSTYTA